jgi:hypothetical protein
VTYSPPSKRCLPSFYKVNTVLIDRIFLFHELSVSLGLHHVPCHGEGEQSAGVLDPHGGVAGPGGVRFRTYPSPGESVTHRGTALSG